MADYIFLLIYSPITTQLPLLLRSNIFDHSSPFSLNLPSTDSAEQLVYLDQLHIDIPADHPQFLTISILKHLNSIQ